MDLKRAWRNGFLISVVFALPLSDLYDFQRNILIANESSNKKTVQLPKNCAGTDCSGFRNGTSGIEHVDSEDNSLTNSPNSLSGLMLESSGSPSGYIRNAALHFSPQDILQSVNPTGGDAWDVSDDIGHVVDLDIGSLASLPYGFGGSTSPAPGHSGPFSPAGFTDGNTDAESGSLNALSDENQTETDVPGDGGTLQNVPEPSSLGLLAMGSISVAALLYLRKPGLR